MSKRKAWIEIVELSADGWSWWITNEPGHTIARSDYWFRTQKQAIADARGTLKLLGADPDAVEMRIP